MIKKRTASLMVALGLALPLVPTGTLMPLAAAAQVTPRVSVSGLEVNHLTDQPVMGIDDPAPVFCWGFDSNVVGSKQESYRIEVATTPAFNANKVVWDSGVVDSDETTDITTAAPDPRRRCGPRPTTSGACLRSTTAACPPRPRPGSSPPA